MAKEERLSGNRLLGEFMGKSFSMSHISDYKGAPDDALPKMKYHHDWSWLMPVWYRFVELIFPDPMDQLNHNMLKTTVGYAILYGEIKLAYVNIIEAIKWYNSKKVNNHE